MKFFLKLKIEILLVLLLILAIVAFFIYGKVRDVMMTKFVEQEVIAIEKMVLVGDGIVSELSGLREEMAKANCLTLSLGNIDEMKKCTN